MPSNNQMARSIPYLQRRGHTFSFRIDVPASLRPMVGCREIIRALRTEERSRAEPLALEMGAVAKRLFSELRHVMNDKTQMLRLLQDAARKLEIDALKEAHQAEIAELHADRVRQVAVTALEAENRGLKRALETGPAAPAPAIAPAPSSVAKSPPAPSAVPLKTVVDKFLSSPVERKKAAMFRKHQAVLPLLLEAIGESKPIHQLRQSDLNGFFEVVGRLPPRWNDECRRRKITALILAREDHPVTLGPKSFEDVVPPRGKRWGLSQVQRLLARVDALT